MQKVKIRRDKGFYIAYFVELRKMVFVDFTGSRIIDYIFNKDYETSQVVEKMKGMKREDILDFIRDLDDFLKQKQDSHLIPEDGFFNVPLSVEVQVNNACNLRCRHCFQTDYSKTVSLENINNILKTLYQKKVFMLNLVGGEIFLHPDGLEAIRLACDKYLFSVNVVTNATLIKDSTLEDLAKIKNRPAFLISLEGVGDYNDTIRGKGVFEKVSKVIDKLLLKGFYVEISCTLNSENIKNYKELIDFADEKKIPCNFNLFKPFKPAQSNLVLKPEEYFDFILKIQKYQQNGLEVGVTNAAIEGLSSGRERDVCRAGVTGMTVDVDGYLLPCALLYEADFYKKHQLPKFSDHFDKDWREHHIFKNFRNHDLRECQACAYLFSGKCEGLDPYGLQNFLAYKKKKAGCK